jgi:hypothetical protein
MPTRYQYLRVRLRIEQARLLNWGERVGLVEDLLATPSKVLQLRRNLFLDLLLEMQVLFKECAGVVQPFEKNARLKTSGSTTEDGKFARRFPKGTNSLLMKVLSTWEKAPSAHINLQWAVISQERLERLAEKLIGLNDAIENLLDQSDISELQSMQQQTHMAILQLNSKVEELHEVALALQVKAVGCEPMGEQKREKCRLDVPDSNDSSGFARLAKFKAQQILMERSDGVAALPAQEVQLNVAADSHAVRSLAAYREVAVWIEWRQYEMDLNPHTGWNDVIRDRVRKLVALLQVDDKPAQFRTPKCLGFFEDDKDEVDRFGLIYEIPKLEAASTTPLSLFELFNIVERPSLSDRITLAHSISECLMYLHSVNWLHKGFRSDNIVFFRAPNMDIEYDSPIIAGFEYARPDLPDAGTEAIRLHTPYDIYRHPDSLRGPYAGSKRSYDIYGLGIVLVEISCWQPIQEILEISLDQVAALAELLKVRERLLSKKYLDIVGANSGSRYREVVRTCLSGGIALGIAPNAIESDPAVGAVIQSVISERVVKELGSFLI